MAFIPKNESKTASAVKEPLPIPASAEVEDEGGEGEPTEADIDEIERAELRVNIVRRIGAIERNYIDLGRDLFTVNERKLYGEWGFPTFHKYLEEEVGVSKRKGERLRQLWKVLVRKLGVSPADLARLRFSSALLILPVCTKDNVMDWISEAQTLSYGALQEKVDAVREVKRLARLSEAGADVDPSDGGEGGAGGKGGASSASEPRSVKRGFKLTKSEDSVVTEALSLSERVSGSDTPGRLLADVCTEFLAGRAGRSEKDAAPYVKFLLAKLEKAHGGRFIWLQDKDAIAAFEEAVEDLEVLSSDS